MKNITSIHDIKNIDGNTAIKIGLAGLVALLVVTWIISTSVATATSALDAISPEEVSYDGEVTYELTPEYAEEVRQAEEQIEDEATQARYDEMEAEHDARVAEINAADEEPKIVVNAPTPVETAPIETAPAEDFSTDTFSDAAWSAAVQLNMELPAEVRDICDSSFGFADAEYVAGFSHLLDEAAATFGLTGSDLTAAILATC